MDKYDVAVCGAGVAGVAAAIAAARHGARTVLIEKQCLLGGLATSGLIYVYLPLCDGYGHITGAGLAWEMMRRSVEYGPFDIPAHWGGPAGGNSGTSNRRLQCCFSPGGFCLSLDAMLREAGVDLWLDSRICGAETEDRRLVGITVANDSGTVEISARSFVDATGGAFVVRMAGGKVSYGENFVTPWLFEISDRETRHRIAERVNIRHIGKPNPEFKFGEIRDGREISEYLRRSWQLIRENYTASPPPSERGKDFPLMLSAMPQLRKIACIDALYTLKDGDVSRRFDDSVGVISDWRRPAPVWEAPYRALLPRELRGILAAGRCIGALGEAWEVFRVIPSAAITGEAAGTAAAMAAARGCDPSELSAAELRRELIHAGGIVDAAPELDTRPAAPDDVPENTEW